MADTKTVFVAGWNTPGYLPDSDPIQFDDRWGAVDYIENEIHQISDDRVSVADSQDEVVFIEGAEADFVLEMLFSDEDMNWNAEYFGIVYWIDIVEVEDE